jgi:hypothetical protein
VGGGAVQRCSGVGAGVRVRAGAGVGVERCSGVYNECLAVGLIMFDSPRRAQRRREHAIRSGAEPAPCPALARSRAPRAHAPKQLGDLARVRPEGWRAVSVPTELLAMRITLTSEEAPCSCIRAMRPVAMTTKPFS